MRKKLQIILYIIVILLILILGYFIYGIYKDIKKTTIEEIKTIDTIESYGYSINENDSTYMKEEYEVLKKLLNEDELLEEEYAKEISKLFVIDFYSLQNAINKNDIGGIQFVYETIKDNFILKAKNTIYFNLENNLYEDRIQTLPVVSKVEIESIESIEYNFEDIKDLKAYSISILISYEEDLEYPTKVNLVLIHNDLKLEIIKIN